MTATVQQPRTFSPNAWAVFFGFQGKDAPEIFPVQTVRERNHHNHFTGPYTLVDLYFRPADRSSYKKRDTSLDYLIGTPGRIEDTSMDKRDVFPTREEAIAWAITVLNRRIARAKEQIAALQK